VPHRGAAQTRAARTLSPSFRIDCSVGHALDYFLWPPPAETRSIGGGTAGRIPQCVGRRAPTLPRSGINQARDGALIAAPAQCPLFSRVPMRSGAPGRVAIGGPSNRRRGRWPVARAAHASNSRSIAEVTIGDCTGLKHRICISCRSTELERRIADWCFPDVRGGHGFGLGGTHERRIWHGRYRRACDRRLHGRLCLRLSRGLSGQGGRGASNAPARGERGAAQAAWPGEGLIRSCSRRTEGRRIASA
jgi:hypothetical protein